MNKLNDYCVILRIPKDMSRLITQQINKSTFERKEVILSYTDKRKPLPAVTNSKTQSVVQVHCEKRRKIGTQNVRSMICVLYMENVGNMRCRAAVSTKGKRGWISRLLDEENQYSVLYKLCCKNGKYMRWCISILSIFFKHTCRFVNFLC